METQTLILFCIAVNMAVLIVLTRKKAEVKTEVKTEVKAPVAKAATPKKTCPNRTGPRVSAKKREQLIKAIDAYLLKSGTKHTDFAKAVGISINSLWHWRAATKRPSFTSYSKCLKYIRELENNAAPK